MKDQHVTPGAEVVETSTLSTSVEEQDAAMRLVRSIRERGHAVRLRGRDPFLRGAAYRALTEEERIVWRQSYNAIRSFLQREAEGDAATESTAPRDAPAAAVQPQSAEQEIPAHIRQVIDFWEPTEVEARREEATRTMLARREPLWWSW